AATGSGGTLGVSTPANGGAVSSIGRSEASSASLVLSGGGVLEYTGAAVAIDRGFTLGAGGGGIAVTDASTTLTFAGVAAGTALRKEGPGTLVLAGNNTYAGATTINGGTLRAGSTSAFGNPAIVSLADVAGVTLDLAGFDNTIGALTGGGALGGNVALGDAILTLQGANGTFAGSIDGTGGLTKQGGGTQVLAGCNNTYTGVTTVISGGLSVDCLRDGGL